MFRYKIVSVPFALEDPANIKPRAAICLTEPVGPDGNIVVALVSQEVPGEILESDLIIDQNHPDFASSGLETSSAVHFHCLTTVTDSLIQKEIGILTPALQAEAREKIATLFTVGRGAHSPCL